MYERLRSHMEDLWREKRVKDRALENAKVWG